MLPEREVHLPALTCWPQVALHWSIPVAHALTSVRSAALCHRWHRAGGSGKRWGPGQSPAAQ